jgi:hypothetical protein
MKTVWNGRAWRLLQRRFGADLIRVIRRRRRGSHLSLRDAVASLARDCR